MLTRRLAQMPLVIHEECLKQCLRKYQYLQKFYLIDHLGKGNCVIIGRDQMCWHYLKREIYPLYVIIEQSRQAEQEE